MHPDVFHLEGTSHAEARTYGETNKQNRAKNNRRLIHFTTLSVSRLWRRIVGRFRMMSHKAFRSTRPWAKQDTIQDISWKD